MRRALAASLPLLLGFDLLQSPNRAVEEGNTRLKDGKAEQALEAYDRAVKELPADPGARFNRGAALSALQRHQEAAQEFLRATEAKGTPLKAAAFYNLGNSLFKAEKYDDAVAAYRRALTFDPNDLKAKWNLELALKKKKEKEEKDKKDQNDQKKDDQKKDDQKQDKDQKKDDPQAKDDKKEEQKQQPEKEQEKQAQQGEPPKPEKAPDMKEIEAVLDSLERSPKDLEKLRAQLRAVRRAAPVKDW